MQHADHLALAVAVHGQPAMRAGGELAHDALDRFLEHDRLDPGARQHDVLHRDVAQVEEVHQDRDVLLRHERRGFEHERADFLGRELGRLGVRVGPYAQQPENRPHEKVHEPPGQIERSQRDLEREREQQGGALRMRRTDHLGGDLGEHDEEEADDDRAHEIGDLVVAEQVHRDEPRDRRRDGDRQRIADQDAAQQPIGSLEHLRDADRAAVAFADEVLEAEAVDRHHRGLGNREERREHEHCCECAEQPAERDVFHACALAAAEDHLEHEAASHVRE